MVSTNMTNGSKPYIVEDRPMISRSSGDRGKSNRVRCPCPILILYYYILLFVTYITTQLTLTLQQLIGTNCKLYKQAVKILYTIEPGKEETGCITCFYSPPEYPILAKCPCFDYPEYIIKEIKASQYIYLRENSIEYNQPTLQPAKSNTTLSTLLCAGRSPTHLTVHDDIHVVYYDDMLMDTVRNDTRWWYAVHTFCCGGRGEVVRLESRFCGECCFRVLGMGACCGCCCCVPAICPEWISPCAARKTIYVEDAETAVRVIANARDDARIRLQVMER